jgi:hypothetical protein
MIWIVISLMKILIKDFDGDSQIKELCFEMVQVHGSGIELVLFFII